MRKSLWGLVIALMLTFSSFNYVEASIGKTNGRTSAGAAHTVTIKSDGTLWAWGYNSYGQLGIGNATNKTSPVLVSSDNKWATVSAGQYHSTAIKSDGTLWAWGYNSFGQLGNGTTTNASSPVQIGSDTKWVTIATGDSHTVAIKSDGTLWAWGLNSNGQLGNATTTNARSPVQIGSDNKWVSISAGSQHTLAIKSDGTLWAWGKNHMGQLGDGFTATRTSPVQIGTDADWTSVSSKQDHTLALKSDGTLWAWGWNSNGQLGDGTADNKSAPTQIGTDDKWVSVKAGGSHTRALKSDGTLWAWGWNNSGQLGNGTSTSASSPVQVGTDNTWVSISTGSSFSVALKSDGTLWSCGANMSGQLGDTTTVNKTSAVQIGTFGMREKIAAGDKHTIVIKSDGTLWAWGNDSSGQLGNGVSHSNPTSTPMLVNGLTDVVSVVGGARYSSALKSDGTVWHWGRIDDVTSMLPAQHFGLSNVVSINGSRGYGSSAEGEHVVTVKSDGTVWSIGNNMFGQLGDGGVSPSGPAKAVGMSNVVSVAAGIEFSVALKSDGTVWMWGENVITGFYNYSPVQVSGLSNVVSVAAGDYSTMALKSDGTVWGWGHNNYGQLGDGTTTSKTTPVEVVGLSNVVSIDTGKTHSIALRDDGTVWTWGYNTSGQLGNGTTISSLLPVQVVGLTNVVSVAGGNSHSIALKSDGSIWTWGSNINGQLGEGTTVNKLSPVQVFFTPPADTTAPVVTLTSPTSNSSYGTSSGSVMLGGSATDAVGVTSVTWSNDRGGSGSCTGTSAWSCIGITLYEGVNNLTISASDLANNVGTDVIEVNYSTADVTAPTVTINSPTLSATLITSVTPLTIGGSAGDAVGVTSVTWSNDRGGSGTCTGTTSWSCSAITLYEGTNNLTVTASDLANNVGTDVIAVSYSTSDITPPSVGVTSPPSCQTDVTVNTITLGGTAYDAVGVTEVTWVNDRGGSGSCAGTSLWSCSSIALYNGVNNITVTAKDAANNSGTEIVVVTYTPSVDTTVPSVNITSPTSNMSYSTGVSAITVGGTAYDAVGVTAVTWFNNRGGSGSCTGTTSWSCSSIALYNGTNNITVFAKDAANNKGNDTITVAYSTTDITPPTGTVTVSSAVVTNGMYKPTLALTCSDSGSGCAYMQFSKDGMTYYGWETISTTRIITFPLTGQKAVYVRFKDNAGNISQAYASTILSSPIGAINITSKSSNGASNSAALRLSCTGQGGCSQMQFSKDNGAWTNWETFNTVRNVSMNDGAGSRTINVKFKDSIGFASDAYPISAIFGVIGTVTINKGDAVTNSLSVSLTLSCQDAQGGACSQMRFSKDNVTWYGWETYNYMRSVMLLSGSGTKYIYVQFKDSAGNTSPIYSDTINYTP